MGKAWRPPFPQHPSVDWSTLETGGVATVEVTCPECGDTRRQPAGGVGYRIRQGTFKGYCYKDRLLGKQRSDQLPRPEHPAINWQDTTVVQLDRQRHTYVAVTCPACKEKRYVQPQGLAHRLREDQHGFTGRCKPCCSPGRIGIGRTITDGGYIALTRDAIGGRDLGMFDALRGGNYCVSEHRLVMSKTLGRPLERHELVDHIDGNKQNNEPSNLRIYRKGDPRKDGNGTGYGLYYDEWQRAESRVRELEAELARRDAA